MKQVELKRNDEHINAKVQFKDPVYDGVRHELPENAEAKDYITSLEIKAVKQ